MDHPDVEHIMKTGYPPGEEPQFVTGQYYVKIEVGLAVDVTQSHECPDEESAKEVAEQLARDRLTSVLRKGLGSTRAKILTEFDCGDMRSERIG